MLAALSFSVLCSQLVEKTGDLAIQGILKGLQKSLTYSKISNYSAHTNH